jgi:hypothetical protein
MQLKGISLDADTLAKGKQLATALRCSSFSHMVRRLIEDRYNAEQLQAHLNATTSQEVAHVDSTGH